MDEIRKRFDIHADNQQRFRFEIRRDAKVFVFKLLYGGSAYGFANQWEMAHISTSERYWQDLIDVFYNKYKGVRAWHTAIVQEAMATGQLVMPTGRIFTFPQREIVRNAMFWRPKILNYPVQGTGADLVAIGRVAAWKRLRAAGIPALWQSTVHDSVDLDVPPEACYNVCRIVKQAINDIPVNFQRLFGVEFDLPVDCEISYGPNLKEQTPYVES